MARRGTVAYRPAIDGLRAIAILSVFIFHLNHAWLPGGFLGVDVFFVISGYLITSILLNDCNQGTFSLLAFYQRRIARIVPVFFTVGLLTVGGVWLICSPQDLASAGSNLTAVALCFANMKFMLERNYFDILNDAKPYLHYWSLSVEEQFYIVFPVLFLLVFKYARKRQISVFVVLFGSSLLLCEVLTNTRPLWAFYLSASRAWELLAGCLVAIAVNCGRLSPNTHWPSWVSSLGVLMILISFLIVREGPHFPGFWPLLPVVGTMGILMPQQIIGMSERLLGSRSLVYIGKISYSLYLWHWPILSLVNYSLYLAPASVRIALSIALSFAAASASFFLIENPARIVLNRRPNRLLAYATLFVALGFCAPVGVTIWRTNYVNARLRDVQKGGLIFNPHARMGSVVLMGDSIGSMYGKLMKELCTELDRKLIVISVGSGNPLPSPGSAQNPLWLASLQLVQKDAPDYLVLACRWEEKLQGSKERLTIAVDALEPHVRHLVMLTQPPILPPTANRSSMMQGVRPPFYEDADVRHEREEANEYLKSFENQHCAVIDIASHFAKPGGELVLWDTHGRLLYYDAHHLSGFGAELARADLRRALSR